MARLTIGLVAKAAGVNTDTVRYYERSGLLAEPPRTPAGYRQYSASAVDRINFIKRAQRLGFTLSEASELLTLHEHPVPCAEVEQRARVKVAEIEEKIAALAAVRDQLLEMVARCTADCDRGCTVFLDESAGGTHANRQSAEEAMVPAQPAGSNGSAGCCGSSP